MSRSKLPKSGPREGDVGIKELQPAPRFGEFCERFPAWAAAEKAPSTIKYYYDMMRILLRHPPLAAAKLTAVHKEMAAKYAKKRRGVRRTGVKRSKSCITHTAILIVP